MANTGANKGAATLITEVKARVGRPNDNVLITASFVLEALNEAQHNIVKRSPQLKDRQIIDNSTFTISTDDTTLDISSLDPAHINKIWILNGDSTRQKGVMYIEKSIFFRKYIKVSERASSEPWKYTRFGNTLYWNCPVSSDYNGLSVRLDYTAWCTAFPSTVSVATSELLGSDKGLRLFAMAECFDVMALSIPKLETKALKTRALYESWLSEYQDYNIKCLEELYEEI